MNTTLQNRGIRYSLPIINSTRFYSLLGMLLLAALFTALIAISKMIFATAIVISFSVYGLYNLTRYNYTAWFSVVCFFCGAESLLRNGLPSGYIFFFIYLIISGIIFLFTHSSHQSFKIFSPTGLILVLAILHFIHFDLTEVRFGLGKWGVIWLGLFFGMWISQSLKLNVIFYRCIWFYMLGTITVLLSFLIAPQYADGRFWPTFDGTGPVAAAIGLLVLFLIQQIQPRMWFSTKNMVFTGILLVSLAALVMLGSRGTFLAIGVAMGFFLITKSGFINKFLIAIFIACSVALVYYIDQSSVGKNVLSSRIEEATEEDTREGRKFINSAVLLSFPEDPFIGKGTGSWRHYSNKYIAAVFDRQYRTDIKMTDAHNTPMHLLFEHGIIGVGFFLMAILSLAKNSYFLSKRTGFFVLPILLFSLTLGLTTMHKQASMFLPFFFGVMVLYQKKIAIKIG